METSGKVILDSICSVRQGFVVFITAWANGNLLLNISGECAAIPFLLEQFVEVRAAIQFVHEGKPFVHVFLFAMFLCYIE